MKNIYWGGLLIAAILFYAYTKECPKNCIKTRIGSCECKSGPEST